MADPSLAARVRGAFLGCALGDAIGRPFEMMAPTDSRLGPALEAWLARDSKLVWTDDTEMMLAVAESIARKGRVAAGDVLDALAARWDPARGYGHGTTRALQAHRRGETARRATWAEGSRGNGGAVRVVAVACRYHDDLAATAAFAEDVAGVTHAHPHARGAAVVHAVALAMAVHDGRLSYGGLMDALAAHRLVRGTVLEERLRRIGPLLEREVDSVVAAGVLGNGVLAEEAVPLALFAFLRFGHSAEAAIRGAVLAGGDTDTIAAMSGALAGACGGEEALPPAWLARLEDGNRVKELAEAVMRGR